MKSEFLKEIETFGLGELVKVAERGLVLKNQGNSKIEDCLLEALEMTPTAGKQISKQVNDKIIKFENIGGFHEVKQKLKEVFLWQNKYGKLYQKCGLRLGGGAILHGPSGNGKSLLMRGLAAESKMNVITVKGPELLSKYIGASEQNVRDVFERARSAKPCLVIFDEFDALAPKRGHDSTGVTDRVVNQLLTELDGVDSNNEGLFVVSATNRIDLMDEALLRPGRFDHKIFVGFPDEKDRKNILEILTQDLEVDENVDFDELSKITDGFSSADLRGIVLNANFKAIDDHKDEETEPVVKMVHLRSAYEEANPKNRKSPQTHQQPSSRVTLA